MMEFKVEFRDWDNLEVKEFKVNSLLGLVQAISAWQSSNCIHDDTIISIEEQ